jgi:hypothetical protein
LAAAFFAAGRFAAGFLLADLPGLAAAAFTADRFG